MIVASAIRLANGSVFVGKRHGDCYLNAKTILGLEKPDETTFSAEQGFINDKLQFLSRTEAYYEAYENGQCREKKYVNLKIKGLEMAERDWKPILSSEDVW